MDFIPQRGISENLNGSLDRLYRPTSIQVIDQCFVCLFGIALILNGLFKWHVDNSLSQEVFSDILCAELIHQDGVN